MTKRNPRELGTERYIRILTRPMLEGADIVDSPTDRQERVPGFDMSIVRRTGIFACGAGGLLAAQGPELVRKGYGRIACTDMDAFDATNYPRQFCYAENLYRNKGIEVARNLVREALLETEIVGLALPYRSAREYVDWSEYDIGLCNVDNDEVRVDFSNDFRAMGKPAIFCAVSNDANSGYVFVQESRPDSACFGCAFPQRVGDARHPCPRTPACVDILRVLGGFALYAVDSVLMPRKRFWNMRYVFLDGSIEDAAVTVKKNPDCPLCGSGSPKSNEQGET